MTATELLGRVPLDAARLDQDLARLADLPLTEPYAEFSCGRPWRSCMVWSPGGDTGPGVIKHYDTALAGAPTLAGAALPYVQQLIDSTFVTDHLLFGRMAIMENDVLVPHRDYVELDGTPSLQRASYRLHIPLQTNDDCFFIEDSAVFRMFPGEIWTLDVSRVHSAAVLSSTPRIHLLLDFGGVPDPRALYRFDALGAGPGVPRANRVERPALPAAERAALGQLASVIDLDNVYQVLAIVAKKSIRWDCGEDFFWSTMQDIGDSSGDVEVARRVRDLYEYSALVRSK